MQISSFNKLGTNKMPFIYANGDPMLRSKDYPYGKDGGVYPRKQWL